ncbi:hypothetical protein BD413DRAFT_543240 [Trametes elegans]|nr:hypothetical protein BD413DRAFT_543240 [Trametes elegans]
MLLRCLYALRPPLACLLSRSVVSAARRNPNICNHHHHHRLCTIPPPTTADARISHT